MKKVLIMLLFAIAFQSCSTDESTNPASKKDKKLKLSSQYSRLDSTLTNLGVLGIEEISPNVRLINFDNSKVGFSDLTIESFEDRKLFFNEKEDIYFEIAFDSLKISILHSVNLESLHSSIYNDTVIFDLSINNYIFSSNEQFNDVNFNYASVLFFLTLMDINQDVPPTWQNPVPGFFRLRYTFYGVSSIDAGNALYARAKGDCPPPRTLTPLFSSQTITTNDAGCGCVGVYSEFDCI